MPVATGGDPFVLPVRVEESLSPALEINPIGSAYRSTSRLTSLGFSSGTKPTKDAVRLRAE